jgi:hypothetical protein
MRRRQMDFGWRISEFRIERIIRAIAAGILVAGVISLAGVFVQATPASAQGTWSGPSNIDGTALTSVSCASASFCAAVDDQGNAFTYNGSSWSVDAYIDAPNYFVSVSCASDTSFCAAVDTVGNALTYNGTSWSAPSDIDGSNALTSVSCGSASFCVAVDGEGNAFTFTGGSSWSAQDIDGSNTLTSVSCGSADFCAAVDDAGNALTYNGSWSIQNIDGLSEFDSVSCASDTSFCAAIDNTLVRNGGSAHAFTYDGSSWSGPSALDGPAQLGSAVSCASASFCVAINYDVEEGSTLFDTEDAYYYDGSSWSSPSVIEPSDDAFSNIDLPSTVSCPSADFCAAVGQGNGASGTVYTYSSNIPFGVATTVLPSATPGTPYGPVTLQTVGEGTSTSPYTTTLKWKKVSLPKGLKLSSAGALSGTPNSRLAAGSSSVTVQVTETVTTLNGKKKVKTKTTAQATIPLTIN